MMFKHICMNQRVLTEVKGAVGGITGTGAVAYSRTYDEENNVKTA